MEEERKEKLQQERKAALDKIFPPPYRLQGKKKIQVFIGDFGQADKKGGTPAGTFTTLNEQLNNVSCSFLIQFCCLS